MEISRDFYQMFLIELFQISPSYLESVGIQTGKTIIEKVLKEKSRVLEPLDMIKILCKDFWIFVYGKQMDNLKTNHRGMFVLYDYNFTSISKFSSKSISSTLEKQGNYLLFSCGLIKGALENMGLSVVVTADVLPGNSVTFNIKI